MQTTAITTNDMIRDHLAGTGESVRQFAPRAGVDQSYPTKFLKGTKGRTM